MKIGTIKSPDWDKTMEELNKVEWRCTNWSSGYKFENPNKEGWWIKNFMKYIRSCDKYCMVATKRHFLKVVGKSSQPSGYMNTFFAAVKDAGIVRVQKEWNGKFTECIYWRGTNWNAYLQGRLKRVY